MAGKKYLSDVQEFFSHHGWEDAELRGLLEEAWRARVATHGSVLGSHHPENEYNAHVTDREIYCEGVEECEAEAKLGRYFLAHLRENPLKGLPEERLSLLDLKIGEALLDVVFARETLAMEYCKELWGRRDWDGLRRCGFIEERCYRELQRDHPPVASDSKSADLREAEDSLTPGEDWLVGEYR